MKKAIFLLLLIVLTVQIEAQELKYRRSSMYSILVRHPDKEFGKDIDSVFRTMPLPDKFDDHNLKVRAINAGVHQKSNNTEEENIRSSIETFIVKNDIAKRLVSKWFNRKEGRGKDGTFDMNLIIERGLYDASYFDVQLANMSIRGQSLLADAGEELIGNTYVLFNDIRYVDKEESAALVGVGAVLLGGVLAEFTGGLTSTLISYGSNLTADIAENIAGFRVSVTSYLYRLEWNEEVANNFYLNYYISQPNVEKKKAYEIAEGLFSLKYVGSQKVVTGKTSLKGVHDKNDMIRKVCERAIDKSVALLQREHEEFRVKTPLYSTGPITAKIGLKEDVNEENRYEVLEMIENAEGRTEYKRVGVIKPIKGRIWDNRFMAEFEETADSTLTATEFEKVSGGDFHQGMLIREL